MFLRSRTSSLVAVACHCRNLVIGVRDLLGKTGFAQNPCLECSDRNADTPFIVQ